MSSPHLCSICQQEQSDVLTFQALEVHTLHIRDIAGEKRVQALGETLDWTICSHCAEKYYKRISDTHLTSLIHPAMPFVPVFLVGILLTIGLWHNELIAFRIIGPSAMFCGVAGTISSIQKHLASCKEMLLMSDQDAMRKAAWECLVNSAPRKQGDNDLSYIPVDGRIDSMSIQELALMYDLLPAIARQVKEQAHR